ncbi:MAG: alkaline phosphatase family protein [Acidobacteriota bacterium]
MIVIGLDGATWDIIDPMMERGELPTFSRLVAEGVRASLVAVPPLSSPVVWTTFATGRFGRVHGVLDHTFPYVPGPKRRVGSLQRRAPTIWNIASDAGDSVGVIGYFATHPPEVVNGVMISDRAAEGASGGGYPAELTTLIEQERERLRTREVKQELRQRYLPWAFDPRAAERPEDPYHDVTRIVRGRIDGRSRYEEFVERVAQQMIVREFDLFMVYLRIIDHAGHATWMFFDDSEYEHPAEPFAKQLLNDIIPATYRHTDDYLGRLLEQASDRANVVILSDHGFGPAVDYWKIRRENLQDLSGNHRPNGIFLAHGPDIRPGRVEGMTLVDVTPNLLALRGLPISKELPGAVREDLFRPNFLAEQPIEWVSRFRNDWQFADVAEPTSEAVESEALKDLAALGYVGGESSVAVDTPDETMDFWDIETRLKVHALLGELLFYLHRDDLPTIEGLIALTARHDPKLARRLPWMTLNTLEQWQPYFEFELVAAETLGKFEARYADELLDHRQRQARREAEQAANDSASD